MSIFVSFLRYIYRKGGKRIKKIVSILLIFSVIIALCLNVSAASVYDVGSFTKTSYLSITNGQATCKSSYSESNGNTASVKITQSL